MARSWFSALLYWIYEKLDRKDREQEKINEMKRWENRMLPTMHWRRWTKNWKRLEKHLPCTTTSTLQSVKRWLLVLQANSSHRACHWWKFEARACHCLKFEANLTIFLKNLLEPIKKHAQKQSSRKTENWKYSITLLYDSSVAEYVCEVFSFFGCAKQGSLCRASLCKTSLCKASLQLPIIPRKT